MRPAGLLPFAVPLLLGTLAVSAVPDRRPDGEAALREGNRRFREGRLEAAVAAYRRGLGPDEVDPVLAYNLGTALHRLGRLPEAVLWYRRARAAGSTDPWLDENLERARADLAAVRRGPPLLLAPALLYPWLLRALAAVLAWSALVVALLAPPRRCAVPGALLMAALVAWGSALTLPRLGPQPAVLLSDCGPELPTGSEVWVMEETGGFRVTGGRGSCPAEVVAMVERWGPAAGP